MNVYEELVAAHGFSRAQQQVMQWTPEGSSVLELGCASGYVGEVLIAKNCTVDAIELDAESAARARERGLNVTTGSLDELETLDSVRKRFDVVIAADVLEHLRDPAIVLRRMHDWLQPGGMAIVAVPNIAAWNMRVSHLQGRFDYEDSGQLDRTHLRFFTWDTFHRLVTELGWVVEESFADDYLLPGLETVLRDVPRRTRARAQRSPSRLLSEITRALMSVPLTVHEVVARQIGPLRPNLCATHTMLRMRSTPDRGVGPR